MSQITLPQILANFESSLASSITAASTTLTLVTSTDADGDTLDGTYEFTIDEGTNNEEHMYVTMVGSAGTIARRGLSRVDAWTQEPTNKFPHNRGASVKITNFSLILLSRFLDGRDALPIDSILQIGGATFTGDVDFNAPGSLATFTIPNITTAERDSITAGNGMLIYNIDSGEFQFYDSGAWQAVGTATVPNGSTTVAGIYQGATLAQMATHDSVGSTGALLIPLNSNLVKISSGAGDENKILILGAAGTVANGFLNASTTPTASKLPIADGAGHLDRGWINFDSQIFTSSGTWTKPANAQYVEVVCIGAGGGGGSGSRRPNASGARSGSGGGGGGAVTRAIFPASSLGTTETITVGAGGSGGASRTSNDSDGAVGTDGTLSSFGTWLKAGGGGAGQVAAGFGTASSGGGGASVISSASGSTGGTPTASGNAIAGQGTSATAAGAVGGNTEWGGPGGGGGSAAGAVGLAGGSSIYASGAGGGGGGLSNGGTETAGGAGGTSQSYATGGGGAGGTSAGGNGVPGTLNSTLKKGYGGSGGGGGGAGNAVAAGGGGTGGIPGGGGGGGGASTNGFNSGVGGDGARGEVRIFSW